MTALKLVMVGKTESLNVAVKQLYTANGNMQNIIKKNIGLECEIFFGNHVQNFCVYRSIILYM